MFKKVYLLFLSIFMLAVQISACDWLASYNIDDNEAETICGAAEAHPDDPNGGFLLVGFYGKDAPYPDLWIRIDRYGNKLWVKKPGEFLAGSKVAHYTEDGGFLLGGNKGLTKINANGDIVSGWNNPVGPVLIMYMEKYDNNMYVLIDQYTEDCYTFNESTQQVTKHLHFNDLSPFHNFLEVKLTKDGKFIFCDQWFNQLLRTDTDLNPDNTFGTNGFFDYSVHDCEYGNSIAVCDDGSGYVIACRKKITKKINLIKINTSGDLVTSFQYTSSLDYFPPAIWKHFHVKELQSGEFILGGVFQNSYDSDLFVQIVTSSGSEVYIKKFENSGDDANY